jgi:hypothetical protein
VAVFYEIPQSDPVPLAVAPRLASWMAQDHPDQLRLATFLDHVETVLTPAMEAIDGPLSLRLDVGLPADVDPLVHHDLDNYLFPLVKRLGSRRFASVWATKAAGKASSIRVDDPRERPAVVSAPALHVSTTQSAETVAFKQEIRAQLARMPEVASGPVELQLSFSVGPSRNWANLWKATIDSLDPILGSVDGRPWNPRDGRVTRLGLHQEVDAARGHAVEIAILASSVHAETVGRASP